MKRISWRKKPMNRIGDLALIILFLVGCTESGLSNHSTVPVTKTTLVASTSISPTQLAFTATASHTPASQPSWTYSPTLPVSEAFARISELFHTNANCQLPCWWGITPGQTKWADAQRILFPLSRRIDSTTNKDNEEIVFLRFPISSNDTTGIEHVYTIKGDVVQAIQIRLNDLSPFSEPKDILREFGVPDEVYLGGEYEPDMVNWQSFWLFLYYVNQRIFVEYSQGHEPMQTSTSTLRICFSGTNIGYREIRV
jgi:hypothetical protein